MPLHLFQFTDEHGSVQTFTRYFTLEEKPDFKAVKSPCGQFTAKKIFKDFGIARAFSDEEKRVLMAQKKYIELNRDRILNGELSLDPATRKLPADLQPDMSRTYEVPPGGFDRDNLNALRKGKARSNPKR